MTLIDLSVLASCALLACAGITVIIGEAADIAADWINRRER